MNVYADDGEVLETVLLLLFLYTLTGILKTLGGQGWIYFLQRFISWL